MEEQEETRHFALGSGVLDERSTIHVRRSTGQSPVQIQRSRDSSLLGHRFG